MTSPEGRRNRAQPLRLELRREEAGTLLGTLAWVLGALQIMRDRGHADEDERFHELHDALSPRIERLVEQINAARQSSMTHPDFEQGIEAAYTQVREAFETWIQLTAVDTLTVAVTDRLASIDPDGEDAGGAEPPV